MRPYNILHPTPRRFSGTGFRLLSVVFVGALTLPLHGEERPRSESPSLAALDSTPLPAPRTFTYERTERDPFVDASVKLTLLSQAGTVEPVPQGLGVAQITQEVGSEILQNYKITGIVCGESDGAVLIGRRILRTGDRLDLLLGDDLLKKMQVLNQAQHLGWGEILSLGILPLEIVWIGPAGIGLSHSLFQEPVTLPFQKNIHSPSALQSSAIPK